MVLEMPLPIQHIHKILSIKYSSFLVTTKRPRFSCDSKGRPRFSCDPKGSTRPSAFHHALASSSGPLLRSRHRRRSCRCFLRQPKLALDLQCHLCLKVVLEFRCWDPGIVKGHAGASFVIRNSPSTFNVTIAWRLCGNLRAFSMTFANLRLPEEGLILQQEEVV